MFEFFESPEVNECQSPEKDHQAQEEEVKSEDSQEEDPERKLTEEELERQQIEQVIEEVKEEKNHDTRENSFGDLTPEASAFFMDEKMAQEVPQQEEELPSQEMTKVEAKTKQILSSFSMKEKYGDLLNGTDELPLPVNYKHLLALFTVLDSNVNLLKARKIAPLFPQL